MKDYLNNWCNEYISNQIIALKELPVEEISEIIKILKNANENNKQIFVFGNGGSAANASHFVTDLGKNASEASDVPFKVLALNDNVSWITAIGNDYRFQDIYKRQLSNYANAGDIIIALSVSGNSPNLIEACRWGKNKGMKIISLIGNKKGKLLELSDNVIEVEESHYGRVEDCQMIICHMLCYAFVEGGNKI